MATLLIEQEAIGLRLNGSEKLRIVPGILLDILERNRQILAGGIPSITYRLF